MVQALGEEDRINTNWNVWILYITLIVIVNVKWYIRVANSDVELNGLWGEVLERFTANVVEWKSSVRRRATEFWMQRIGEQRVHIVPIISESAESRVSEYGKYSTCQYELPTSVWIEEMWFIKRANFDKWFSAEATVSSHAGNKCFLPNSANS